MVVRSPPSSQPFFSGHLQGLALLARGASNDPRAHLLRFAAASFARLTGPYQPCDVWTLDEPCARTVARRGAADWQPNCIGYCLLESARSIPEGVPDKGLRATGHQKQIAPFSVACIKVVLIDSARGVTADYVNVIRASRKPGSRTNLRDPT